MDYDSMSRSRLLTVSVLAAAMLAGWSHAGERAPVTRGQRDREAILRELQDFSLAGMDRRLGPDYAFYHGQGEAEKLPEIWMPPAKPGGKGRRYQVGGPWTKEAGDYSSTQGQILYVPDQGFGADGGPPGRTPGVRRVTGSPSQWTA